MAAGLYYCSKCRRRHRRRNSKIGREHLIYEVTWSSQVRDLFASWRRSAERRRMSRTAQRSRSTTTRQIRGIPEQRRWHEFRAPRVQPPSAEPPGNPDTQPWPTAKQRLRLSVRDARQVAKRHLQSAAKDIAPSVINYVFDEEGFYEKAADKIIEGRPYSRRQQRGHWVCQQLGVAAKLVDSGTYEKIIGETLENGLKRIGVNELIATGLRTGAKLGVKATFDASTIANLSKAFRALIPLVCPNLGRCPEEHEVVKTYAGPLIAEDLTRVADALGAPRRS